MATIGTSFLNLIDTARAADPATGAVLEMLSETNPVLDDAWATEANMSDKHRHTIRTGLPSVTWGQLYQGIPQSKGHTQVVDDTTGFVEGLSTVDERLIEIQPKKTAALRLQEASGFIEAMNQEAATGIFYHDTATTPEKFKGLGARYNTLTNSNVVNAGGTGSDNTSIWFVTWGDPYTSLIYPEGTPAGMKRQDMGRQRVTDAAGNPYFVQEELFRWHLGLSVGDWRYNSRVANIDVSNMRAGSVDVFAFMIDAYYKLQSRRVSRPGSNLPDATPAARQAIYMNSEVLAALDKASSNRAATDNFVRLTPREIEGREVMTFRGIPIRETDALLNTETALT